jgi:hypothetical protein
MGYIAHDAVIAVISDYDTEAIAAIEDFRKRAGEYSKYILGPTEGINGYNTYVFTPDGSKEGWGPSDTCDQLREAFIAVATKAGHGYGSVVHVRFGGDYGYEVGTKIVATTDQPEPIRLRGAQ